MWGQLLDNEQFVGILMEKYLLSSVYLYISLSGSVVECLSQDQGVAGSSITSGTSLCP